MSIAAVKLGVSRKAGWWGVCWIALLTIPAAVAAYYRIFLGFSGWDDEGMDLSMVRQYLTGAKLFEEVFSPYGPVYYFYNWVLHSVLGLPLNHNTVRLTSVALVLVCCLGCAWIVWRFTQSLVVATIAHLAVFRGLQFFVNEPGHPQELCLVLLLCLVASGILAANPRWRMAGMIAAGSLAGLLLLIKVNVGIFAIMAVALSVLLQAPPSPLIRAGQFAAALAAIAIPFLLMRSHLDDPSARAFAFIVTVSVAALIFGWLGSDWDVWFSYRECWAVLGSFGLVVGVTLAVLAMQGVTLAQVVNMLVLKHLRMSVDQRLYYFAINIGWDWTLWLWMAWALAGLGAAMLYARGRKGGQEALSGLLRPAQFLFGCAAAASALVFPKILLPLVLPFGWLLLYPPEQVNGRSGRARMFLCTLMPLQSLTAYPAAGSQSYFIRILLMIAATLALSDGLIWLRSASDWGALARRYAAPAGMVVMVCAFLVYPLMAYRATKEYARFHPLGMPGAELIHSDRKGVAEYHWLVANLSRHCDTFVSLPGMASLYFWSGKPLPGPVHKAPGGLSLDNWTLTHSPEEQQVIVDDLEKHPDACAVYTPRGIFFWYKAKPDLSGSPLATYIFTRFKTVDQMGDYQFMIRKERQWNPAAALQVR